MNATISHAYDAAGRKTATYEGAVGTGKLLSQWDYDQELLGALSATSRFVEDATFTTYYTAYDEFYRARATYYEVPAAAGDELARVYDFGVMSPFHPA
ncbi:hypothetical protein O7626_05475 [Micromonospora sp. WMMD1102]|uniref:hypothetical protein n=1 Tax=Micromonospora sp. WMMD1102 TaxID=3016105 RepID=UPI002415475A|nr:hypothetical protein [Micromonospora sp. WMMD1102]MDG4785388.1 hypothetical protein [Micromonospora sp. WMMD1102]